MLTPRSCFDSVALSCCLSLILSVVASGQAHPDSTASEVGQVPGGIGTNDWSSIRDAYEAGRHSAEATEHGFEARNPGQGWSISFDSRGFLVEPDASEWRWGLELVSYGFEGAEQFVGDTACTEADGGRLAYSWDDNIDEWYINDKRGFEHGFTVHERPVGGDDASGELTLQLRVRGDLSPQVQAGRRGVTFMDTHGSSVLNYSGLTVFDADGKALRSWFELAPEGLRLSVDEREARYPLTIDPIAQQAYLKASNTGALDFFGWSVAISDNTVVVGACDEDSNASGIDGDQTNNGSQDSGAAYVFARSGSVWSQQAYLKASNTDAGDQFGWSVAISGDTIVVGAIREGSNGDPVINGSPTSGAVYVFTRSGSVWNEQAYLKASNIGANDLFGESVAISDDTIVVGAAREDSNASGIDGDQTNNGSQDSGAAYVFARSGSVWSQQAYLKASNTDAADFFGRSVAISDNTVVVGAYLEDSNASGIDGDQANNGSLSCGAVYVFARSGSVWNEQAYLKASNTDMSDWFGLSVAISDDTVVVGAEKEDSNASGIDGDQANNGSSGSGAAYVFARSGSVWSQQAYLKASNTGGGDRFGWSVAISDDTIVVGAIWEASNAIGIDGDQANDASLRSGAAYVFRRSGSVWSQQAYLKASNTDEGDRFGHAVAISGDAVVVGAAREDCNASGIDGDQTNNGSQWAGAAYVFDVPPPLPLPIDLCSGDGGDQMGCTDCPCMNNATAGSVSGCLNSAGTGLELTTSGDASVSLPSGDTTDLRFGAQGAPTGAFCILNSGDALAPGNMANPCFGMGSGGLAVAFDGLRCAIMNTRRHGGRSADGNGDVGITNSPWGGEGGPPVGIAVAGGGFVSGQTRYFQIINRDDPLLVCMRGLNTSQAVEVTFTP